KTQPDEAIDAILSTGQRVFGENRVQEARDKIAQLGGLATWHLIGSLQKNKAKYAVKLFDLIHSVDSLELAQEIDQQAARAGKIQRVLIEVNIAGEDAKAGINVGTAVDLAREAAKLRNIRIQGLMTMPPYSEDPENSRPYFQRLRELAGVIIKENISGLSLQELSMGMSGDFEVAVEEGATMVRVGTAIFGSR
ncbi:MAG TPA: YggS family pyridoxal phosphate-dependent enzyme, partial [Nitrospiraceae bacterium]|nr:YggS family pyridoxal phosphate-dependent enzyme [Nitrospiraceae bacterium]